MKCDYLKFKFDPGQFPSSSIGLQVARGLADGRGTAWATDRAIWWVIGGSEIKDNDDARALARCALSRSTRCTRIDFCQDYEGSFDYARYYESWGKGRKPRASIVMSSVGGVTVYVGKRSSARMLRVYNKRIETLERHGVDIGFDLIRVEVEFKRSMAPKMLELLTQGRDLSIWRDVITRYRLHMLDSCESYRLATSRVGERSPFRFVERYRHVLSKAYYLDARTFIGIITRKEG